MPIFSYECENCGRKFDELILHSDEESKVKCPGCSGVKIKKEFAPFSVGRNPCRTGKPTPECISRCPSGGCGMG